MSAIEVDLKGLAKLLERRGIEWIALELIQNAWDTATEEVRISLESVPGHAKAILIVEDDDPEGFIDLSHAWTLFAESLKKDNPLQRGRFNMGEKLVLAYCLATNGEVTIKTTKGTVHFDKDGRKLSKDCRASGSEIRCEMKMTRAQLESTIQAIESMIPPVQTMLNGIELPRREPVAFVDVSLPTEIADEEGVLRRTVRKTTVGVYELWGEETASVFEMGLPVVETGDKWHYDVQQKVPLNMERDNVPPSFLKSLRVAVLNHMHSEIEKEDSTTQWVQQASSDKRCSEEATEVVVTHKFGERRVAYDPSDPEANKIAMGQGYTVVPGGSLSKGQWENSKKFEAMLPAGRVTPSPEVYSPDGEQEDVIPEDEYTHEMKRIVSWSKYVGNKLMGKTISIRIVREGKVPWCANYGNGSLCLNYPKLGKSWFANGTIDGQKSVNEILIHEFAHQYSSDHFSHKFLAAMCSLGAKLGSLMYERGIENKDIWETD